MEYLAAAVVEHAICAAMHGYKRDRMSDTLVVLPTMHATGFKSCTGQSSGALAHSLEHSEIAFFPDVK